MITYTCQELFDLHYNYNDQRQLVLANKLVRITRGKYSSQTVLCENPKYKDRKAYFDSLSSIVNNQLSQSETSKIIKLTND